MPHAEGRYKKKLEIYKNLMAAAKQAAATYGLLLSAFVRMLIAREIDDRRIKT